MRQDELIPVRHASVLYDKCPAEAKCLEVAVATISIITTIIAVIIIIIIIFMLLKCKSRGGPSPFPTPLAPPSVPPSPPPSMPSVGVDLNALPVPSYLI